MNGYDCITCGPMSSENYHDSRDGTPCGELCLPEGECQIPDAPSVKGKDGLCYWRGENGGTNGWGLPDPAHRERTEGDPPAPIKPLVGQIGFDGAIVR